MVDEEYVKQLEAHIEGLNKVIDKLLVKENLLYYVKPKGDNLIQLEDNKRYFKTIEDVFIAFLHMGGRMRLLVSVDQDYAKSEYAGLSLILDIYSLDVITGERKKVWG